MEQVFQISVLPGKDRDPEETGDLLGFKYSSVTLESNSTILINIDFDNPAEVSMAKFLDKLKISINKTEFAKAFVIISPTNRIIKLPADQQSIDAVIDIPMQIPKDEGTK